MTAFEVMRANMIDGQILPNKITDVRLIDVLSKLPRELFVAQSQRSVAYIDDDIEIAPNRYLMEPRVFARLVQALAPGPDEVGLYIGCGSGYGVAVLANLCNTVIGLECDVALAERASGLFAELEIDNAVVVEGPLDKGYAEQGPYDLVLIEGAISDVPSVILDQLAESGRLAAVVSSGQSLGEATIIRRVGEVYGSRVLFNASSSSLPGFEGAPEFTF
ncbi:MAG TPA: protein-L-isoaspartate O-methyltransferase [Alphaproteobacteria bacterium]|nr:protein-L-isoaspartate O-methyltransferase [Alphaproteobacteria bacterium]